LQLSVTGATIGNGGWVELHLAGRGEKPFTLVRFALDSTDELKIVEVYLEGKVTSPVLRFGVDVSRLEAVVNVANPALGESIRNRLDVLSPDMRGTAEWYGSTGRGLPYAVSRPRRVAVSRRRVLSIPNARLSVPSGSRLGHEFYKQLGEVWRRLDAAGVRDKNKAIADANGIDPPLVASWVKRARKIGCIPQPIGKGSRS
jgi:hypothetical protein